MAREELKLTCFITPEDDATFETSFDGSGLLGVVIHVDGREKGIVCMTRQQVGQLVRTLEGALAFPDAGEV